MKGIACAMPVYPEIKLSALRDIGWGRWDPIGLALRDGGWPADCADEYDSYLKHAAGMLVRGNSRNDVAAYLAQIASEHMGLSEIRVEAAAATANAIADYILDLPNGPPNIG
jgi:hypothetical protein